jgi:hypothetical protein
MSSQYGVASASPQYSVERLRVLKTYDRRPSSVARRPSQPRFLADARDDNWLTLAMTTASLADQEARDADEDQHHAHAVHAAQLLAEQVDARQRNDHVRQTRQQIRAR